MKNRNPSQKKFEYKELKDWWKSHKNSLKKESDDMVPIFYEYKSPAEMMTNAIMSPNGAEGKQWWSELRNYTKGQTSEKKNGYQYDLGDFPNIFKQVKRPIDHKK